MKITTYEQAFDLINVKFDMFAKLKMKSLEREGYKEQNICFAVWKGKEKIMAFRCDPRFWSIFINEVRKWAFKSK